MKNLERQQKINAYLMYITVGILLVIAGLSVAGAAFGIFRTHPSDRTAHVRPILPEHMPEVGGQVAVTYENPTSDAINEMIAQGYVVEAIVNDTLEDQSIVVYKRVR